MIDFDFFYNSIISYHSASCTNSFEGVWAVEYADGSRMITFSFESVWAVEYADGSRMITFSFESVWAVEYADGSRMITFSFEGEVTIRAIGSCTTSSKFIPTPTRDTDNDRNENTLLDIRITIYLHWIR